MQYHDNGLLVSFTPELAGEVIAYLVNKKGFKYLRGELDCFNEKSLYSPTLDRQLGHWGSRRRFATKHYRDDCFYLNPSLMYHLPAEWLVVEKEDLSYYSCEQQRYAIKPLRDALLNIVRKELVR